MHSEVMATYFKWGHRKNRSLLTAAIATAMCVSLGIQGWLFYSSYDLESTPANTEHLSKNEQVAPSLTQKDFELLFGFNEQPEVQKQPADIPKTRLNLVLRGALAELGHKDKKASAIIQGSNQDKLYAIGDTLPGGATLKEIHPDHVVLSRNGQLETLYFPDAGKDSRALQEYKSPIRETRNNKAERPGFTQEPDGKSLEERMQELKEKLQQNANQGI